MRGRRGGWIALVVLALVLAGSGAAAYLARRSGIRPEETTALLASVATLGLLLVPWAALSFEPVVMRLRGFLTGRPFASFALALGLICPYFSYWAIPGNANLAGILGVVAYVALPALLAVAPPLGRRPDLWDALVVIAIWLPVEFRWLSGSFPWPPGGGGSLLLGPLGIDLLLYLMLVVRATNGVGYSFGIKGTDLKVAFGAFAAFVAVGIPIGLSTGFLAPSTGWPDPLETGIEIAAIFLFTAVPEETLFRGFIQGFLERRTGRPGLSLCAASLLFGLAHLNNGPFPDWRYVLLATLAGVAYGWAYQRTGRIVAPALTHMLVDATWAVFLKG